MLDQRKGKKKKGENGTAGSKEREKGGKRRHSFPASRRRKKRLKSGSSAVPRGKRKRKGEGLSIPNGTMDTGAGEGKRKSGGNLVL